MEYDPYEKQKESAGKFATFAWIACGFYLYLTSDTASIFSISGAIFFLGGMFVSAVLFGLMIYGAQRTTAKMLTKILPEKMAIPRQATIIKNIGILLFVVQLIVIYIAANWTFNWLNKPPSPKIESSISSDLMEKSFSLAFEMGASYQMSQNCDKEAESLSPQKAAGLFINYMSEKEVQLVIDEYAEGMNSKKEETCNWQETASAMLKITQETALYISEASPYMKPIGNKGQ